MVGVMFLIASAFDDGPAFCVTSCPKFRMWDTKNGLNTANIG